MGPSGSVTGRLKGRASGRKHVTTPAPQRSGLSLHSRLSSVPPKGPLRFALASPAKLTGSPYKYRHEQILKYAPPPPQPGGSAHPEAARGLSLPTAAVRGDRAGAAAKTPCGTTSRSSALQTPGKLQEDTPEGCSGLTGFRPKDNSGYKTGHKFSHKGQPLPCAIAPLPRASQGSHCSAAH